MERERKRYAIFLSTHTTAYAIIAIFLVLAWIPFDYLIDRKHFLLFLLFRILFTVSVLAATILFYKSKNPVRHYRKLGIFVYLLLIATILPMVLITEEKFAYFLGFSTVFYGTSIIMIWPIRYLLLPMAAVCLFCWDLNDPAGLLQMSIL